MAILSSDGTYVTVQKGDVLWRIARDYGNGATYQQLAAINNIPNPNLIYVNQKIYLTKAAAGGGGSGSSSSSSSTSANSNQATITAFGVQSDSNNTLFATWSWSKGNTDSYAILWLYDTGDGVWFVGSDSSNSINENEPAVSRQSTYTIPDNANRVKFKVKPISKTYTKNKKETVYWTADWSTEKIHNVSENPPSVPNTPNVDLTKYTLTASLDNIEGTATGIQFQIVKDNETVFNTGNATITTGHASYSCTVEAGSEYKVRCRAYKGTEYSDWSQYSNNYHSMPSAPASITTLRASSETSVYLEWPQCATADAYDIEYTTKKEYFDGSNSTTTESGIEFTHFELTGLETGQEYFFRVRSTNQYGESAWSEIKSVKIGKAPVAPTTWSSTTTVITGEPLNLYWVHNTEDGSSQTYAEIELYINGVLQEPAITVKNSEDEDEKDKTSSYSIDTSEFTEGTELQWRVRTAGVTLAYGDWSVQRTVDIYAPPTLTLKVTNLAGVAFETLDAFPFYVYGLAGPNTQLPIGYHLTVSANESYETVDRTGNPKMVAKGEKVYSKYFDISEELLVEFSANNIDLENNISYTVTCTVSMNSGLTAEASSKFSVNWTDIKYTPNAEIGIDEDTYTASIRPYCEDYTFAYHKVTLANGVYTKTEDTIDSVFGSLVPDAKTSTGEQVYSGISDEGEEVYYCEVETSSLVEGILLSVYRRNYDGTFTEIATGLKNTSNTYVTDPHPALDYARYRIVATTETTGAVSYYDVPGYPVGGKAVIIQWAEEWSNFNVLDDGALEQPPWSGSLLKLPYNIDVSDSHSPDVALIEYIGRTHPISYYGTQLGETSSWNVEIAKNDEETLYGLRRLARWMGDAYVREPSGSGYWAHITVSFSQTHLETTIPVTFDIKRVEGGV